VAAVVAASLLAWGGFSFSYGKYLETINIPRLCKSKQKCIIARQEQQLLLPLHVQTATWNMDLGQHVAL